MTNWDDFMASMMFRSSWERTPRWMFWRDRWRRRVINVAGEYWEYATDAKVGTDLLLRG